MFTWEEAGLLRQMLLVLKWTVIAAVLVAGACFRHPLMSGASFIYHGLEERLNGRADPTSLARPVEPLTH